MSRFFVPYRPRASQGSHHGFYRAGISKRLFFLGLHLHSHPRRGDRGDACRCCWQGRAFSSPASSCLAGAVGAACASSCPLKTMMMLGLIGLLLLGGGNVGLVYAEETVPSGFASLGVCGDAALCGTHRSRAAGGRATAPSRLARIAAWFCRAGRSAVAFVANRVLAAIACFCWPSSPFSPERSPGPWAAFSPATRG